jgi:hypothetical protein
LALNATLQNHIRTLRSDRGVTEKVKKRLEDELKDKKIILANLIHDTSLATEARDRAKESIVCVSFLFQLSVSIGSNLIFCLFLFLAQPLPERQDRICQV